MGHEGPESLPQTTTEIQSASNSNPVPKTEHVFLSSEILFLSWFPHFTCTYTHNKSECGTNNLNICEGILNSDVVAIPSTLDV